MSLKDELAKNNVKYIGLNFKIFNGDSWDEKMVYLPEKVPFIKNPNFDDNENELIYGLKRYIFKIKNYTSNYNEKDFFKNEMAFEASLYCLLTISDISKQISEDAKLCSYYQGIDFTEISKIYQNAIKGDMFDMSSISDALFYILPFYLLLIYLREGVIDF